MSTITLTAAQLSKLLTDAAEAGAAKVLARLQPKTDLVSQHEAWRQFGRKTVEGWVADGLIIPRRTGSSRNSKLVYSLSELKALTSAIDTASVIRLGK